MSRILCLWFPNWAIQRAIRAQPKLKERPLALVTPAAHGSTRQTSSIVAMCCGKAFANGVRPGMPLAEAQTLAPNLAVATYDTAADHLALRKLAETCERFSPRVAVEENDQPESLLLDISNLDHLYRSESKLAERVKTFFTRRGYQVRLAIGNTVGAAWAAAHFDENREDETTTCETVPSSFVIHHSLLPIEALRIHDDTASLLHELGIQTIDQLLALPREELASRFGEDLLRRVDQLTGIGRELIEPHRALPPLSASYALEQPTGDRAVLLYVLGQLVEQLSRQLITHDEGAVLLTCLLRCTGGQEVPLRIGLLQPSAKPKQLMELIELHLENVRLPDEVDRLELHVTVTGRLGERQRELFGDRWPTDSFQLAVLLNRLSSRLGHDHVLRAELRKSPVPERAMAWKPVTELKTSEFKRKHKKTGRQGDEEKSRKLKSPHLPLSPSPLLAPRPLTLYSAPAATDVVCIAPDGPPQFIWMKKHRERIVSCVGPERIESLWWRGPSVRRDYYRVTTESGGHLWMFRQLTNGEWFVHGEFS
jgi:protein ImuB